jgi:hypothetical protein
MTLGSSFHRGAAHNLRQKVESHTDLPVADVLDAFATDFDWRKKETEWGEDDPGEFKDRGVVTLKEYQKVIAPQIQPVDVEQEFVMRFADLDYTFVGVVDALIETAVVELKTTAKSLKQPRHDHLLQTWGYCTGMSVSKGVSKGRLDYAIAKTEPEMLTFDVPVSQAEKDFFLSSMTAVAKGIKAEIFIANRSESNYYCSRRKCAYWSDCEKHAGGRVRD